MSLRDSLPRFANNPYYILLVSVATLISVPLTIVLYFESQHNRDLVFTVDPARTIIARAGGPSELKVEFKGDVIKTDVVGVQVSLWNQGKGSIRASDVLTPLEIRLNPPAPILQVSAAKTSRSVIALTLENDAGLLRQGRIPVTFRILERDDGGNIQIIYAGPSDVEISLVGVVEGAGAPRNLRATGWPVREKGPPSRGDRLFTRLFPWFYVLFLFVVPIPAMIKHLRHRGPRSARDVILLLTDCLMFAGAIGILFIVFRWFPYVPTPPFGY
ncbi:MAG: hypothetical protein HYV94_18300 [Candidatus Rokubacteria bacterium]|nr:hypothetical protein [Candidatus Rokubacteria bacterium]